MVVEGSAWDTETGLAHADICEYPGGEERSGGSVVSRPDLNFMQAGVQAASSSSLIGVVTSRNLYKPAQHWAEPIKVRYPQSAHDKQSRDVHRHRLPDHLRSTKIMSSILNIEGFISARAQCFAWLQILGQVFLEMAVDEGFDGWNS